LTRKFRFYRGAVAIAAFIKDGKMILTKQYRHLPHKLIYDLPAGGIKEAGPSYVG